jgi:RNA polymerase sigma-70 factor (ECF subfamily)
MQICAVHDSERELILQAKSGSTSAFEQLVDRFETRIFRIVQRITNHYQDSEDVIQNAFLKAFRNLSRFRGDSSFYTWLVRIAVNESIMTLRRRRPNEFSIDEACEFDDISVPRELKDRGPNPEQLYSQQES